MPGNCKNAGFAPFTPELRGALSGPQTPCRKATSARVGERSLRDAPPDFYTDLSTLHFGVATPLIAILFWNGAKCEIDTRTFIVNLIFIKRTFTKKNGKMYTLLVKDK